MDLESENSALESTGDNDLVCSGNLPTGDDVQIDLNGPYHHDDGGDRNSCGNGYPVEIKDDANKLNSDEHDSAFTVINSAGKDTENGQPIDVLPASPSSAPVGSPGMSSHATGAKGKGLRKWRRIRRDFWDGTSGGSPNPEVAKVLKRGSANLGNSLEVGAEMKQKSEGEGSVSSTNAFVHNPVGADSFSNAGSSSAYTVAGVSTFSVGADSENSEDRSSKSSTAASMPKSRIDQSRASGHSREKYRIKHMGKKHLGNAPQMVQQDARRLDGGKKPRGEAVNIDKENSLSSLESDSRNYSSVFMQGSSSAISNGHSGRLMGSDGEHSDDEPAGEEQSVEGLPTGPGGSVGEGGETSRGDAALSCQIAETFKNHKVLGNEDPLDDCVQMLQSVQEVLEQELQKFADLGKDLQPLDGDLTKAISLPISSKSVGCEIHSAASNWPTTNVLDAFATKLVGQARNVGELVKQLEETTTMLKEKETRIAELEATVKDMKSSSEDLWRSVQAQQKKYNEIEAEMEILFEQKMEAEIKYLAIADKSTIAEREMKLLQAKQESLASTQAQEPNKKDDLERKSALLKDKTKEGLAPQKVTSRAEIQKLENRITKVSFYISIQLFLILFMVDLFLLRLLPKSGVVMPT